MSTRAEVEGPLQGESSDSRTTPDTSALWDAVGYDDANASGVIHGVVPVVTIESFNRILAKSGSSMLTDYYNHIFVIPEIINLKNPKVGLPQPYQIWNAFLEPVTLESINEVDTTGLTNSAIPPIVFKHTEVKDFTITIGVTAPIVIDALYTFIFNLDSGTLQFLAERAVLLNQKPSIPFTQELNYDTDILIAHDGTEQRIGVRPAPRTIFGGKTVFESDAQARTLRAQLFLGPINPIVIPHWHEPFFLDTAVVAGVDATLSADFLLADWLVSDFIYIETSDESVFEIAQITTIGDASIILTNVVGNSYPIGSRVYPASTCALADGAGFARHPVNASELNLAAETFTRRLLGGKEATVPTYNSLSLLDERPLNNSLVNEAFSVDAEKTDHGGVIRYDYGYAFSKIFRSAEYLINSREELQFWKLFLDGISGRREPFYTPTFRADLNLFSQPTIGGSLLIVTDKPNYLTDWWISDGHKSIVLTNILGDRLYRTIITVVDNGDGTIDLTIDVALPGTADGSNITKIEFLELVHLGTDKVTFKHYGNYSTIGLAIGSTKE